MSTKARVERERSDVSKTKGKGEIVEDVRHARDGSVVVRRYEKGSYLGKGGFARCYKFLHLSRNRVVAGKVIAKTSVTNKRAKAKLLSEIEIHRSLSHPHVVRFESFFEDKKNVYIILELCHNQTLMELMSRRKVLTEPEVKTLMLQLVDGVRYLHHNNVIHRDLKLGNLFLSHDMQIKIGDFGLAALLQHPTERKKTICGTPNYIAPEVLEGRAGHSFEVDVWSLGVILYTMLVGKPPFQTDKVKATYRRIRSTTYEFPAKCKVSESAKQLIRRILQKDPRRRPTLDGMLHHPFFNEPFPRAIPAAALRNIPKFAASDMIPGRLLVSEVLERPIPKMRVSSRRSKSAAAAAAAAAAASGATATSGASGAKASSSSSSDAKGAAPGVIKSIPVAIHPAGVPDKKTSVASSSAAPSSRPRSSRSTRSSAATAATAEGPTTRRSSRRTTTETSPAVHPLALATERRPFAAVDTNQQQPTPASGPAAKPTRAASSSGRSSSARVSTPKDATPPPVATSVSSAASESRSRRSSIPLVTASGAAASSATSGVSPASASSTSTSPAVTSMSSKPLGGSSSTPALGSSSAVDTNPSVSVPGLTGARDAWVSSSPSAGAASPKRESTTARGTRLSTRSSRKVQSPSTTATATTSSSSSSTGARVTRRTRSAAALIAPAVPASSSSSSSSASASASAKAAAPASTVSSTTASASTSSRDIMGDTLKVVHDKLAVSIARSASAGPIVHHVPKPGAAGESPQTWVTTWVDYTTKYGLGYMLNNGSIGVYFNDSTKIILASNKLNFEYMERTPSSSKGIPPTRQRHTLKSFPNDLNKKVTLLKHFQKFLGDQYDEMKHKCPEEVASVARGSPSVDMPYVKKWVRTRHAVLFRLSNRTIQTNFPDHTAITLCSDCPKLTYVSKDGLRSHHPLATIMAERRPDIAKRLKYTKDILSQLIRGGSKSSSASTRPASATVKPTAVKA